MSIDRDLVIAPAIVLGIALAVSGFCFHRMRMIGTKDYPKWWRISERIVLSLVVLVAVTVGAGATINAVVTHHYRSMHPAAGTVYVVDGYKMHLHCSGEGSPTIILDAGLGDDSLIWAKVQPELAKTTRVCSYDRAGFGWSDPRPGPRDADRIAQELHLLLTEAGISGPIVLMGHSAGGLYIRAYATRYPNNLAGLVFVDGSTPLQEDRFPDEIKQEEKNAEREFTKLQWLEILGETRAMGQCKQFEGFDDVTGKMIAENQCRASQVTAMSKEHQSLRQSGNETVGTGPFGDVPILIFSQDPEPQQSESRTRGDVEFSKVWNEMQEELKHLSTRSRRIIATGSGHYIQVDRPDLLNAEVTNFIQQIRANTQAEHLRL
ncbi:MAG TPA: alpha/beta hydrolase [Candidatus Eremiobacteraceae bacterium]|nr:alpha/beta hydrolase [Candidatus Eremiobacteraceae bacterium]